jgi:cytochrome c peroxidase
MFHLHSKFTWPCIVLSALTLASCESDDDDDGPSLDTRLRSEIYAQGLTGDPGALRDLPSIDDPVPALGRVLFFTKGLGGDEDSACVSCHHPLLGGGDDLALSIGVGAEQPDMLGPGRVHRADAEEWDGGPPVPRNAPTTFNTGYWDSVMFHDGRVESLGKTPDANGDDDEGIRDPDTDFGEINPDAGDNLAWDQARFPVTSPEEMRGFDFAAGESNEELRSQLVARFQNDTWLPLFQQAFDSDDDAGSLITERTIFEAIGAYERSQEFSDSPWSAYVQGDDDAIDKAAKRGALLFIQPVAKGGADCVQCHSGDFFTDELFAVMAFPQAGRGKGDGDEGDEDFGRFRETGDAEDLYAFRVPTLLNVAATGPWGHAGMFATLEQVVRHHLDPADSIDDYFANFDSNLALLEYNGYAIQTENAEINTRKALAQLQNNREQGLGNVRPVDVDLSDEQIDDLIAFLKTLTDPRVDDADALSPWIASDANGDPNPDGLRVEAIGL